MLRQPEAQIGEFSHPGRPGYAGRWPANLADQEADRGPELAGHALPSMVVKPPADLAVPGCAPRTDLVVQHRPGRWQIAASMPARRIRKRARTACRRQPRQLQAVGAHRVVGATGAPAAARASRAAASGAAGADRGRRRPSSPRRASRRFTAIAVRQRRRRGTDSAARTAARATRRRHRATWRSWRCRRRWEAGEERHRPDNWKADHRGITVLGRAHSEAEVKHLLDHGAADARLLAERELGIRWPTGAWR